MIKRYPTRCLTCGHPNTLRITLGTESTQEHTFGCAGCGEDIKVSLKLDFVNRESYNFGREKPITFPTPTFCPVLNCELCEQEGTITNLDPNFLVPEDMLHTDRIFPWMYAVRQSGIAPRALPTARHPTGERSGPVVLDILDEVGIPRFMSAAMHLFCKLWRFYRRGETDLVSQHLRKFEEISGFKVDDVWDAGATLALAFLGKRADADLEALTRELVEIRNLGRPECDRFRMFVREEGLLYESIDRQVDVVGDYLRGFDQFNQTWIYASSNTAPTHAVSASSSDMRSVRLFYGEAFEQLATALLWPACLNNIKNGRSYDLFERMTLAKYLTINKAKRADPFKLNAGFSILHDEYDSTLRNASHHGAIRLKKDSRELLEFRSGDTGQWKRIRYTEYLVRCVRIQMCMMRMLLLQILVGRPT